MRRGDNRTITVDQEKIAVTYLGKGAFCTAYRRADNGRVIVVSDAENGDHSKELLSFCEKLPHIPDVSRIDGSSDPDYIYEMPYYNPLTASNKEAWSQYRELERVRGEGVKKYVSKERPLSVCGYQVNNYVVDNANVPGSIKEALEEIASTATNYGEEYVFEFCKRNLCVDDNNKLILLDVIFNFNALEKLRDAQIKKARGW